MEVDPLSATFIAQLVAAIAGGATIGAILNYVRDRRKAKAGAAVAEGSIKSKVDLSNIAALQAQLVYLEKVIEILGKQNDRFRSDLELAEREKQRWIVRVSELEDKVQTLKLQAAELAVRVHELQRGSGGHVAEA